ncbi:putative transmembrane 1 protein, partial [Operophtera brumata]
SWYRLDKGWSEVGELTVTIIGARGLSALGISCKADAYCVLELDNSRVQTHTVSGTTDPTWDKNYTFAVNDVTSTLDITVYDESLINENLGRISVPLLRIENDEKRWYALKNRSKKTNAKGNCPRILVQMSLVWNPKPSKFSIPLIYSNLKFIRNIFSAVAIGNEHFNLANFTVPYLSYLAISAMVLLSIALYLIPINYLFMAFGIYKFGRRFLNPDRVPNNDILDFISRVPDDEILLLFIEALPISSFHLCGFSDSLERLDLGMIGLKLNMKWLPYWKLDFPLTVISLIVESEMGMRCDSPMRGTMENLWQKTGQPFW